MSTSPTTATTTARRPRAPEPKAADTARTIGPPAAVAERSTQRPQKALSLGTCGFEPHPPHYADQAGTGDGRAFDRGRFQRLRDRASNRHPAPYRPRLADR